MSDQLKNLKPGEKYIEVKEKYVGKNGNTLAYEVSVYTYKKILFIKKIHKYTFSFYFGSKKLINEFFKYDGAFKISLHNFLYREWWEYIYYELKLTNINKSHYRYMLMNGKKQLEPGNIWYGSIMPLENDNYTNVIDIMNGGGINQLYELEKEASKENTYGNIELYKLQGF